MPDNIFIDIQHSIASLARRVRDIENLPRSASVITTSIVSTSVPPTAAQLTALFDTPAAVGVGFVRMLDVGGTHTHVYVITSDGTNWWYATLTKAT